MSRMMRRIVRLTLAALSVAAGVGTAVVLARRPSNERAWSADQARLPVARFEGTRVHVANVRNFDYRDTHAWTERWEERSYDLAQLESVWFIVEPFGDVRGPAHTFVSFGFADSVRGPQYVAVSVEIRKERGESFDPLRALFRTYELTYVVGDERDLVRLRSNFRRDSVFMYRVATTPEKARSLFVGMLERANKLAAAPEFYNTLTSTCTTNIVAHVNTIAPDRVPFSYKTLLPAFADELAYELGLIPHDLPFAEARKRALINERALKYADDPDFSRRIREG
jgi:hypothetical protein